MTFEHPTGDGVIHLTKVKRGRWAVKFNGRKIGYWPSPDAAASAVARRATGLSELDRTDADVPDDPLDWRPLGDSL